jgi:tape measure domain-containing protein
MAAADFESTQVAFATLIGDAAKAEETLAKLRKLGAETPFEFPELADAGRKLIAFGEDADTVPETLRRIGDVSAGIQAPVGEIAELYGKARVQGRLFAEDINQLTGRGIPVIQELARQFGVSDSQVKKLVETGQVGFPAIERAFIDMTSEGGKFAGMMAQQSRTTKGLFSTLKDTVNEVFLPLAWIHRFGFSEALSKAERPNRILIAVR